MTTKGKREFVQVTDGTRLYIQDWGAGRPIVFAAAWTFTSNIWGEYIAAFSSERRCVAFDRRGHGRSDAPSFGYDIDSLADDIFEVFEQLDLRDATLVAHSMGTVEAVRYLTRHGTARVSNLVLIAPTTPFLRRTADNPDAIPDEVITAQYRAIADDYPRWIAENEAPFFTQDTIPDTRAWIKGMMLDVPLPIALACRRTISDTDCREELANLKLSTLIIQGDEDASAPLPLTGVKTHKLIQGSELLVYPGAPHALPLTHRERLLKDLRANMARND